MSMENTIMNELYHYGVSKMDGAPGRGSGRYPLGSGEEPKALSKKAETGKYGKHLVDQYVKDVNNSRKLSGKEKVATVVVPALIAGGLAMLGSIAGLPVASLSPVLGLAAVQSRSAYEASKASKVTKKYEQEYGKDFIRKSIDAENERKKRFDEYTRKTY